MAVHDDILPISDSESSPVDNLPVGAGKKRRGRPRKARVSAESAAVGPPTVAGGDGAPPPGTDGVVGLVKEAVSEAIKKNKPPGLTSRRGIVGLAKQVARVEARKLVGEQSKEVGGQVGLSAEISKQEGLIEAQGALSTQHGQDHPFWHLLRQR